MASVRTARTFTGRFAVAASAAILAAGVSAATRQTTSGPTLTGVLHDETGRPVAHAAIQACTTSVCFPAESGADGRFRFELHVKTPVHVLLKTPEQLTAPRRAAAMLPVDVRGPTSTDVGTVFVPSLPAGVPLAAAGRGRQTLSVGDGLELSLDPAHVRPAPGHIVTTLAARRLPAARVAAFRLPAGERIVAVYALHPFGASSETPVGVGVPSTLVAGTAVTFRTMGELDGTLSDPASGRATGSHVTTAPSAGITHLTYLVISR